MVLIYRKNTMKLGHSNSLHEWERVIFTLWELIWINILKIWGNICLYKNTHIIYGWNYTQFDMLKYNYINVTVFKTLTFYLIWHESYPVDNVGSAHEIICKLKYQRVLNMTFFNDDKRLFPKKIIFNIHHTYELSKNENSSNY